MQYRYSSWLSSGLAARKKGNAGSNPGCEWAISTVPDEFLYVCFEFFLLYFLFCPVIFSSLFLSLGLIKFPLRISMTSKYGNETMKRL